MKEVDNFYDNFDKSLRDIQLGLDKLYPNKNPMITIFGDGSWSVEMDGIHQTIDDVQKCRVGGAPSGDSINKLKELLTNVEYECQVDGCTNEIETPKMCCDGRECGCMGMPTEPPVCSEECYIAYIKQIRGEDK